MTTKLTRHLSALWPSAREPYPPESTREPEIALVVEFLKSGLGATRAVYISAPITTGRTFVEWLANVRDLETLTPEDFKTRHRNQVVSKNIERVQPLVDAFRRTLDGAVIDPTAVGVVPGWTQSDYRVAWREIIHSFVHTIVFLDGWEYSSGCTYEFLIATHRGLKTVDQRQRPLSCIAGADLIRQAIGDFEAEGLSPDFIKAVYVELTQITDSRDVSAPVPTALVGTAQSEPKDAVLDRLASIGNVAQFVSFDSRLQQRFSRIIGYPPNARFRDVEDAASVLLKESPEGTVNVRSFDPQQPKGSEFVYGIRSIPEVVQHVNRLVSQGLFTIINETVDVHDGGVSGVSLGEIIEFAPDDTPRCVEKPGVATLPRKMGVRLLEVVYGFTPALPLGALRVEFSVHPIRRGYLAEHTIIWEVEPVQAARTNVEIRWPHVFSRMIGDKTFGLLVADAAGLPVPRTTVVGRRIAPFSFGTPTGTGEVWLRTAPPEAVPGRFTTRRGWLDPYKLLSIEDPTGTQLSGVLAQEGVPSAFAGAAATSAGEPFVEGVRGYGDRFMLGEERPIPLPQNVFADVRAAYALIRTALPEPVKFEWSHDGQRVWILQLQQLSSAMQGRTIVPGQPSRLIRFDVRKGLEALRELIPTLTPAADGVVLEGDVGLTSHFGDVLRRAGVPSWVESTSERT
jgi:hypothetical protein